MRKFHGRTRTRLLAAGFATAVAVAAAVATAAPPAMATNVALTVVPAQGGLTGTLTVTGTSFLSSITTPAAYFSTSSCGGTYGGSPPATLATITKVDSNTATVAIGTAGAALSLNSGVARLYYLCVFAGSTSSDAIAGNGTYTVAPNVLSLSPSQGPAYGTVTVTATGSLTGVTAAAAYFSTSSCPITYGGSPPATVASATVVDANSATVTLGAGAAALTYGNGANKPYGLCVFDATAGAGTSNPLVAVGSYTVAPAIWPTGGLNSGTVTVTGTGTFTGITTVGAYFSTSSCSSAWTITSVTTATVTRNSDDQVSIAVPTALSLNSGAARPYYLCIYNGTTAGTSALNTSGTYIMAPSATTVAPATGASGGGGTLTVTYPTTSAILTAGSYYVGFATGGCSSAYTGIPAARQSATVTKVSTTQLTATVPTGVGGTNTQGFAVCVYSASTGDTLVGASATNAYSVTMASSQLGSIIGAGANITVNITSTNANAFATSTTPAASFFLQNGTTQYCPGSYTTIGVTAAQGARKASNTKASVQFPTSALASGQYTMCVYTSSDPVTSKLAAAASYTVAPVPALSTVAPASGPTLGNNTVTVTGANLPTNAANITITIGNIMVQPAKITAGDGTYFTFVAPPHSPGAVDIVVKTDVGTASLLGAYAYANSLSLATNTAPNTNTAVTVDVFGQGFQSYTFSTTANAGGHVYLMRGRYDGTLLAASASATTPKERTNADVLQDCSNVWVVDDTELLCNLDLTQTITSIGTQSGLSGVHSETLVGTTTSLIVTAGTAPASSSTAVPAFTQADVGKPVATTASKISAGTFITKVVDGYTAVLNQPPLATNSGSIAIGYTSNPTVNSAASGATTLTAAAGAPFDSTFIGRLVTEHSGSDIPTATYITGVNSAGTTLTLSQALTGTVTSVDINSSNAVPPGAYNIQIVSDATPGSTTNTTSAISSGSTFTVASF